MSKYKYPIIITADEVEFTLEHQEMMQREIKKLAEEISANEQLSMLDVFPLLSNFDSNENHPLILKYENQIAAQLALQARFQVVLESGVCF